MMLRCALLIGGAIALIQSPAASQTRSGSTVTLAPGDLIEIEVWREEDLSGEFLIDESGTITLPLLGERKVAGIPLPDLRAYLLGEYRQQLQNPSINIIPLRRVYVLGEVRMPGLYNVDPTVSLAGAIAMAEGTTQAGDMNNIRVARDGVVVAKGVRLETPLHAGDIRSGDQIIVGERSWFVRNSTFVVTILIGLLPYVFSRL